jgi:aspartyl-tRNA(Asn)/glutamyl-tRNA(Gln) amidotransferase subunit A
VDESTELTLARAAGLLADRTLSPVEVLHAHLDRIHELDDRVKAFVTVIEDRARADAATADAEIGAGRHRGPLHGIPVVVKDLIATAGVRTTAGSRILKDWVPDNDAAVVRKLKDAGAVIVGKVTTHEFAASVFTPPTRNPWNLDHIPGGSSGGSAAALAAHMCLGAIGTDTAGSIRIPASLCGVVGLKPTHDLVSRHGVVPLSWSLDHVGPMARTVEDVALILEVLAERRTEPSLGQPPTGLRLGVPNEFFFDDVNGDVAASVLGAIDHLGSLGMERREVTLPTVDLAPIAGDAILLPESSAYHARWLRTRPHDYGRDVRTLLELGEFVLATDYLRAQRVRTAIAQEFARAFETVDVIAAPATPVVAPAHGQRRLEKESVLSALCRLNYPANLAGLPALSLPCGFSTTGLPIGLHLMARPYDEATLLRVAHAYEQTTAWHARTPQTITGARGPAGRPPGI